jgi:hypothetical protein
VTNGSRVPLLAGEPPDADCSDQVFAEAGLVDQPPEPVVVGEQRPMVVGHHAFWYRFRPRWLDGAGRRDGAPALLPVELQAVQVGERPGRVARRLHPPILPEVQVDDGAADAARLAVPEPGTGSSEGHDARGALVLVAREGAADVHRGRSGLRELHAQGLEGRDGVAGRVVLDLPVGCLGARDASAHRPFRLCRGSPPEARSGMTSDRQAHRNVNSSPDGEGRCESAGRRGGSQPRLGVRPRPARLGFVGCDRSEPR